MNSITADRLAETEYTYLADPRYVTETEFGCFYNHPHFRTRTDAHQLMRTRCAEGDVPQLLAHLDELYADTGLEYQKITGHDPDTLAAIDGPLQEAGWSKAEPCWMLPFQKSPQRAINADIELRAFDPRAVDPNLEADLDSLFMDAGEVRAGESGAGNSGVGDAEPELRPGYRFHRAQDSRVGGECVLAYLAAQPIASTGWFVVDGIVRFRRVETIRSAWGQGAATAMLAYVQNHPVVQQQDALVIFCNESGPLRLYEEMGFVKHSTTWEFLKAPWANA